MALLILEALVWLAIFDRAVRRNEFARLYDRVLRTPVSRALQRHSTKSVSHAIDVACALYVHNVHCLQRSAATAVLLRRHGIVAEMVVGVRVLPFKSHAWVEVDGHVVNDKPYVRTMYQILERC